MNAAQETGDMLVVTLPVPTTDARELSVWIEGLSPSCSDRVASAGG